MRSISAMDLACTSRFQMFAGIFEIHGNARTIDRLYLTKTPVRLGRMPDQRSGYKIVKHSPSFQFTEINLQEITVSLIPGRFLIRKVADLSGRCNAKYGCGVQRKRKIHVLYD